MLKIGDFSRLSRVSVKALRYYDEIGLLRPAYVDSFTSYRYYAADQLTRLNHILALKDLGFTLEQTIHLLDDAHSPAQMHAILRVKQAEIQRHVADELGRLARIEARLRALEDEHALPTDTIVVKRSVPQLVAAVRDSIASYPAIGTLYAEIAAYLGSQAAPAAGPSLAIWHDEEYREANIDAEAAVPIDRPLAGNRRVRIRELPAGATLACTVHHGSYDTLGRAYNALLGWITGSGYRMAGPIYEIYLHANQPIRQDDPTSITEIRMGVEREDRPDLEGAHP